MKALIAVTLTLFSLAACGGGDKDAGGDNYADCADVWTVGETVPKDYRGCTKTDGDIEAAVSYVCADDSELIAFEDLNVFALLGGKVQAKTEDTYSAAYEKCSP